ncbi:MAG: mechanosensitive ion channel family protein [Rhodobacteraceae bacterium]|nr:mechanosensitive ion channel family protein [Paracoccaceae bacterium]
MTRALTFFFVCLLALLPLATLDVAPAQAQQQETPATQAPDYEAWEEVAQRAEEATEAQRASNAAFEGLREEIAKWREVFLTAQTTNQTRVETLRSQIAALGPAPAEGETEAAELADRRRQLNEQLVRLEAPRKTAEEAYNRSDGLIREIDAIIRDRQADALLKISPSPVNPARWPEALTDLVGSFVGVLTETSSFWALPTNREEMRANLPATLTYLVLALVLLARGRGWMETLTYRILSRTGAGGRGAAAFIVSLGQVILPYVGIRALMEALDSTGLIGLRGQVMTDALPTLVLTLFGARWLGVRLFPKVEQDGTPLVLTPEKRAEGRFYAALLGLLLGIDHMLRALADYEDYSEASRAVLSFPILVVAGLMLLRFGQFLRAYGATEGDETELSFRERLIRLVGRAAMLIGPLGIALAAIGYHDLADFLVFPSIQTLALFGLLVVLHQFIVSLYALVARVNEDTAGEALIPILVSFAIWLAAVPVAALIWGARVADLTEVWARFREGFVLGETVIRPTDFLVFVFVFVIGYLFTRALQAVLKNTVLPKTKMDSGGQNAIRAGVGYVGIFFAALVAISTAGIDLSSLAIVAGALSVGIGFGLQNIVSNFVSGIILLIERPVKLGDWVEVNGQMGYVRDISVRSTRIETFDRTDLIVPNADLIQGTVTNYTLGSLTGRVIARVGVAYGTDTRKVEKILREIAEAHPLVAMHPKPRIVFMAFGADALEFEIRAILRDVNYIMDVLSDFNHEIARRFGEEGIEIPFAQRDLWLRNPEALKKLVHDMERDSDDPEDPDSDGDTP